jgi:hypothetical protein
LLKVARGMRHPCASSIETTWFRCDMRYGQLLRSTVHYTRWFQMSVLRKYQIHTSILYNTRVVQRICIWFSGPFVSPKLVISCRCKRPCTYPRELYCQSRHPTWPSDAINSTNHWTMSKQPSQLNIRPQTPRGICPNIFLDPSMAVLSASASG